MQVIDLNPPEAPLTVADARRLMNRLITGARATMPENEEAIHLLAMAYGIVDMIKCSCPATTTENNADADIIQLPSKEL